MNIKLYGLAAWIGIASLLFSLPGSSSAKIGNTVSSYPPVWNQVNADGFGSSATAMIILEPFKDQLYAAANDIGSGPQIWRTSDGTNWNLAANIGASGANWTVLDMIVFRGYLYAGTAWGTAPAEIWRTADGIDWKRVMISPVPQSGSVDAFVVFQGQIYAAFAAASDVGGVAIYRSRTGGEGSWVNVVTHGNGDPNNVMIRGLAQFKDHLYAVGQNQVSGAFVWQSSNDGSTWTQVNTPGFDSTKQLSAQSIAIFDGALYVGTFCSEPLCTAGYSELWKSTNGKKWSLVSDDFGEVTALYSYNGSLYIADHEPTTIWKSDNGTKWRPISSGGWGDNNNQWSPWDPAFASFHGKLYVTTTNWVTGAEIWQMMASPRIY
jgi:hypothetical protein